MTACHPTKLHPAFTSQSTKRFFGAAKRFSLYFLADGAKEESVHLERSTRTQPQLEMIAQIIIRFMATFRLREFVDGPFSAVGKGHHH
jgi:hypothetical protein